jgi:hypothetical protein
VTHDEQSFELERRGVFTGWGTWCIIIGAIAFSAGWAVYEHLRLNAIEARQEVAEDERKAITDAITLDKAESAKFRERVLVSLAMIEAKLGIQAKGPAIP